jgi:hypothetical protein
MYVEQCFSNFSGFQTSIFSRFDQKTFENRITVLEKVSGIIGHNLGL